MNIHKQFEAFLTANQNKESISSQIDRISTILGNKHTKTCLDCGFQYIPMSSRTEVECPECSKEFETVYESVSHEDLFED